MYSHLKEYLCVHSYHFSIDRYEQIEIDTKEQAEKNRNSSPDKNTLQKNNVLYQFSYLLKTVSVGKNKEKAIYAGYTHRISHEKAGLSPM